MKSGLACAPVSAGLSRGQWLKQRGRRMRARRIVRPAARWTIGAAAAVLLAVSQTAALAAGVMSERQARAAAVTDSQGRPLRQDRRPSPEEHHRGPARHRRQHLRQKGDPAALAVSGRRPESAQPLDRQRHQRLSGDRRPHRQTGVRRTAAPRLNPASLARMSDDEIRSRPCRRSRDRFAVKNAIK